MGIDTSIYGQLKPVQIDGPLDVYSKVAQFQQMQQQNKLADLLFAEKQRAAEFDGKRRNALTGAMNPETGELDANAYRKGLAGIGDYEGLQSFQKTQAEQSKLQREAQKADLETKMKRLEASAQIMAGVKDQASWDAARQQAAALFGPEAAAQMPEVYDPALIEQKRMQAIPIQQQLEQQWKALNFKLDQDKFAYQQKNDADNRNVTIRGQNLTDARAGRANELKQQEIAAGGKPPAGYRWAPDGQSLVAIPGGPADKAAVATEGERKAATLLKRLEGSQSQLAAALNDDPNAAKPGLVANGLRMVGAEALANTAATSPARQRVDAAQLDILDAALTLGTGAAYTREQLEGYRKSYFPQIGDDAATISDKQARLNNVIEAAKIAAGRAAGKATAQPSQAQSQTIKFLGFE